jgi:predicted dithiol-disulfide oxidoreductase (DUF899 family)
MRQREKVAALRRRLPLGVVVEDYEFLEGPRHLDDGDAPVTTVRLRELFSAPDRALVVQHVMYGKQQTTPCPMCTMWVDGLNGVVRHIARNADFVVASAADPAALRAHARHRGWDNVRLLSCGDNTFQYDLAAENEEGQQDSTVSVFVLDPEGRPRHFYSCHPRMADDIQQGASTSSRRSGACSTSRRRAGANGSPAWTIEPTHSAASAASAAWASRNPPQGGVGRAILGGT